MQPNYKSIEKFLHLLKRIALKEEEEENMNDVKVSIKKE